MVPGTPGRGQGCFLTLVRGVTAHNENRSSHVNIVQNDAEYNASGANEIQAEFDRQKTAEYRENDTRFTIAITHKVLFK